MTGILRSINTATQALALAVLWVSGSEGAGRFMVSVTCHTIVNGDKLGFRGLVEAGLFRVIRMIRAIWGC